MAADLTPERRAELRAQAAEAANFGEAADPLSGVDLLALLDAADERDRLRAEVETWRTLSRDLHAAVCGGDDPGTGSERNGEILAEVERLRADRDDWKERFSQWSSADESLLDAMVRQRELEAEVERLRAELADARGGDHLARVTTLARSLGTMDPEEEAKLDRHFGSRVLGKTRRLKTKAGE